MDAAYGETVKFLARCPESKIEIFFKGKGGGSEGGDGKGDKGRAYNRLGVKIQRESQKSFRGGEGKNDAEGVERLKSEDRESWRDRLKTVGSFYMRGEMREGAGTERKA